MEKQKEKQTWLVFLKNDRQTIKENLLDTIFFVITNRYLLVILTILIGFSCPQIAIATDTFRKKKLSSTTATIFDSCVKSEAVKIGSKSYFEHLRSIEVPRRLNEFTHSEKMMILQLGLNRLKIEKNLNPFLFTNTVKNASQKLVFPVLSPILSNSLQIRSYHKFNSSLKIALISIFAGFSTKLGSVMWLRGGKNFYTNVSGEKSIKHSRVYLYSIKIIISVVLLSLFVYILIQKNMIQMLQASLVRVSGSTILMGIKLEETTKNLHSQVKEVENLKSDVANLGGSIRFYKKVTELAMKALDQVLVVSQQTETEQVRLLLKKLVKSIVAIQLYYEKYHPTVFD